MKEINDDGNLIARLHNKASILVAKFLGDKLNYSLRYYRNRHRWPNFKHPKDLSERILSSMLSPDFVKYADLADKVKVRDYVKSKGLESILLEQYGSWPDANMINWNILPDKFILKANNGCGGHIVCTDKSSLDKTLVVAKMNDVMNISKLSLTEPHYAAIKPLILCEQLMGDGIVLPEDYKFMCINGIVDHIMVIGGRESGATKCTMSPDWEMLPYMSHIDKLPKTKPDSPKHLAEMIKIAEILSADFEFVRVDLYDFDDRVIFGELTFSPNGGMMYSYTNEAIEEIGRHFKS